MWDGKDESKVDVGACYFMLGSASYMYKLLTLLGRPMKNFKFQITLGRGTVQRQKTLRKLVDISQIYYFLPLCSANNLKAQFDSASIN
jgi:hypothetical protein